VLLLLLEPGICCAVNAVLYLDAGWDYFRTAYWTYAALVIMRVARCVKEKAMREKYGIFVRNKRASWTKSNSVQQIFLLPSALSTNIGPGTASCAQFSSNKPMYYNVFTSLKIISLKNN
jgi:hypothetical protein